MNKTLLYVINVDWFFLDHRLPVAIKAKEEGYKIIVASSETKMRERIESYGFEFLPIPQLEKSQSLFAELLLTRTLHKLYKTVKPDIVHHVTIRPVLYGAIASRTAKVPAVVNELTGMGYLYIQNSILIRFLRVFLNFFFRRGFSHPNNFLILQNRNDVSLMEHQNVIDRKKVLTLGGTGVDERKFMLSTENGSASPVNIIYTGRMLWDKGIGELVEAAGLLHDRGVKAHLHLYGGPYAANPKSIPVDRLQSWNNEEYITWHGHVENIGEALRQANIVCLPSYREGLPKSLLEAASVGRAIVTTDVPGCRDVVEDGVNGYLVPARDADSLADRLAKLAEDPGLRARFGMKGRERVEQEFRQELVVERTLELYEELLYRQPAATADRAGRK